MSGEFVMNGQGANGHGPAPCTTSTPGLESECKRLSSFSEVNRSSVEHMRSNLFRNLLDETEFWLNHSIDTKNGGFFSCIDRQGQVYDNTKYGWMQGRQLWMMSRLYKSSHFQTTPELEATRVRILAAVDAGATFMAQHFVTKREEGLRCYFSAPAEGGGGYLQRKIFSECFCAMGFVAYSALCSGFTTSDAGAQQRRQALATQFADLGIALYRDVLRYIADPSLIGAHVKTGGAKVFPLNVPMILLNMCDEARAFLPHALDWDALSQAAISSILLHAETPSTPSSSCFTRECVATECVFAGPDREGVTPLMPCMRGLSAAQAQALRPTFDNSTYSGRQTIPGHTLEAAWFVIDHFRRLDPRELSQSGANSGGEVGCSHLGEPLTAATCQRHALRMIDQAFADGWDSAFHGGLLYFIDARGRPQTELEASMKLWWPINELMVAGAIAYEVTKDKKYWVMLERAVAFAQKFIAPESGAWLGYLHRDTTVSMNIIGGAYKGFFHVPRALMFCVDACDRILAAQKSQQ